MAAICKICPLAQQILSKPKTHKLRIKEIHAQNCEKRTSQLPTVPARWQIVIFFKNSLSAHTARAYRHYIHTHTPAIVFNIESDHATILAKSNNNNRAQNKYVRLIIALTVNLCNFIASTCTALTRTHTRARMPVQICMSRQNEK